MMSSSDQFGTYDIEEVLGRGSMGVVYRARHELTHREVALKVLFPNVASTEMGEERFKREVRVSAMVDNEGIVDVFDAGKEEDEFFYAMELLDGRELTELLPTYTWREGLACLVDVTASLAACHEAGIIHRDLKPDNIFVVGSGERAHTKLLDFGMASVRESPTATQTGFTLGTPAYMSPEQARDATEATPASDIWSIGVILYELIAGRLPFDGDSSTQVMLQVIEDEPPSINPDAVDAPPRLVEIVDRCLQKKVDARFARASELHAALLEVYEALDNPPPLPSASQLDLTHPSQPTPVPETCSNRPAVPIDDETARSETSQKSGTGGHASHATNSRDVEGGTDRRWGTWILAFLGIVAVGTGLGLWVAPRVLPESDSEPDSSKERAQPTTPDERETSRDLQPDDIRKALAEARRRTERATLLGRASIRAMAVRSHTRNRLEALSPNGSDSADTQESIRPTFKAAPPPRGERKDSSSNSARGSDRRRRRADESSSANASDGTESTEPGSDRQAQGAPAPEGGARGSDPPQDEAPDEETSTVSTEDSDETADESSTDAPDEPADEASSPEPPSEPSEDSLPPVEADESDDGSPTPSDSPSRAEPSSDETGSEVESSGDSSSDAKESETTESKDDSSKSNTPAGDDKDEDKKRPPFSF